MLEELEGLKKPGLRQDLAPAVIGLEVVPEVVPFRFDLVMKLKFVTGTVFDLVPEKQPEAEVVVVVNAELGAEG